jgi:hypothetical protein
MFELMCRFALDDQGFQRGGVWFFSFECFRLVNRIRRVLSRRRLPVPASSSLAFGGGGYGVRADRLLLGGSGRGGGASAEDNRRRVALGGGSGSFDVGYVLVDTGSLRLYPLVGIGGSGGFAVMPKARRGKYRPSRSCPAGASH